MSPGPLPDHGIPARIETERLVIRCWTREDAPRLREAIDVSLDHLREWMPWAMDEPKSMEETRELLQGFESKFGAGEDFTYGIFTSDESEVIGGSGLHPRIGADGLEIGYWIRVDRYRLVETRVADRLSRDGEPRDTLVFEIRRDMPGEG